MGDYTDGIDGGGSNNIDDDANDNSNNGGDDNYHQYDAIGNIHKQYDDIGNNYEDEDEGGAYHNQEYPQEPLSEQQEVTNADDDELVYMQKAGARAEAEAEAEQSVDVLDYGNHVNGDYDGGGYDGNDGGGGNGEEEEQQEQGDYCGENELNILPNDDDVIRAYYDAQLDGNGDGIEGEIDLNYLQGQGGDFEAEQQDGDGGELDGFEDDGENEEDGLDGLDSACDDPTGITAASLREYLEAELGAEVFHQAMEFLRKIDSAVVPTGGGVEGNKKVRRNSKHGTEAGGVVDGSEAETTAAAPSSDIVAEDVDDYLLAQMERIVGVDGLTYLDDMFQLITLEDSE
jgi:hypothetical protein